MYRMPHRDFAPITLLRIRASSPITGDRERRFAFADDA
jgi:hypothetical protein